MEKIILTIPHPTNTNHNGGMLVFGPDDYLYIGVGDGGGANDVPNNAQSLDVLLGKILRIDIDVPERFGTRVRVSGRPIHSSEWLAPATKSSPTECGIRGGSASTD